MNFTVYLEYRGIPISLENLNGRIIFTLAQSDEIYKLTSAVKSKFRSTS
jgi:hypothetical protein